MSPFLGLYFGLFLSNCLSSTLHCLDQCMFCNKLWSKAGQVLEAFSSFLDKVGYSNILLFPHKFYSKLGILNNNNNNSNNSNKKYMK